MPKESSVFSAQVPNKKAKRRSAHTHAQHSTLARSDCAAQAATPSPSSPPRRHPSPSNVCHWLTTPYLLPGFARMEKERRPYDLRVDECRQFTAKSKHSRER